MEKGLTAMTRGNRLLDSTAQQMPALRGKLAQQNIPFDMDNRQIRRGSTYPLSGWAGSC